MNRSACSWTLRSFLVFTFGVLLSVLPLHAQVDTGSITGTVTDASGAVVNGAKVTLTNQGTGASLTVNTTGDGTYTFSPVRIGSYKIDASAQGFKTVTQSNVVVNVNANVLVNLKLPPGSVSETVEVTTSVPVLQTQDASVGQVMDSRNVNNLPLNGRNFTFLAQLSAGVNSPQADTRGNAATGAFSANGFRPAQNNYMLDGIDNNSDTVDFLNGTNFVVLPPVDAIQEFKVQTTNFSAEFGRSGAAVLNATIKSGTNQFHGSAWEFFRNDKLDAADYFERVQDANGNWVTQKGELRQNQYGFTAGGPVVIPHVIDGRNKLFFFGDFEALSRRQGTVQTGSVPTTAERTSGYTNLQDMITGQSGTHNDILGRTMPLGTVLDPATTRSIGCGVVDPVSGLAGPTCGTGVTAGTAVGFARDPFGTCPPGTLAFTLTGCGLNMLPVGRLDTNAIQLLNLFPSPTSGGLTSNYTNSPVLRENRKAFDARLDINFTQKDQLFYRFSFVDDPQFIPSIFGGVADGGGFFQGNQTALAQQSALVWNHVISPTTVNNARAGLNYLHTTRNIPEANNLSDLPGTYGIKGIPQEHENGGLPAFGINGLQTLGGNAFLPSDEVSSTIQLNDDFTKIYGKHTFKMGIEWQHVKFSTLQPPWSRGQFNFDGTYTDIPNVGGGNTGRAQFLLTPQATTVPGGTDYVGGPNNVFASNISLSDNGKNYYGTYVQDDWKMSPKLTLNLGIRWDYFGLVYDHYAKQANFVPGGPPSGGPLYIIPPGPLATQLSSSFQTLLSQDGIGLAITKQYGKGLGKSQTSNWAPRFGFAYQATPKFVVRGGVGMFYNGFENRGYSPNLGENYPFQFSFQFQQKNDATPINQFQGCADATPTGGMYLETGFACIPLDPLAVNAQGLQLRGIQFDYKTPYSIGSNLTLQYEVTPSLSVQAGYVGTYGRHLEVFPNSNLPTQLLPPNTTLTNPGGIASNLGGLQFPDFAQGASYAMTAGSSYYHGLQTSLNKKFSKGLDFLFAYTWSKVRSDASDLLNGFASAGGYRAPYIPGMGIHGDYGLANFDIRNVVHFSGTYQLPFGKGQKFMGDAHGVTNALVGGWSVVWASTFQGGQPFQLACPSTTAAGTQCLSFVLNGASPRTSLQKTPDGNVKMLNAAAFAQPCEVGSTDTPTNCIPMPGVLALGGSTPTQIEGPGYHRLDFSIFKDFQVTERMRMQFRTEFFNLVNHPNFNYPGFGGNGVVAVSGSTNFNNSTFGEIGSTRDAPYGSREIQFALKLYF
ncbi:MAG TPA: TonB-dependent receptor [Candidatus Binatia bacterium]|nr:TonB-dependent receptor [Candidatus Binatia bacterium]